jgi:ribosome-associated translation inhibitor RaiA
MQVHTSTDRHVNGSAALAAHVERVVTNSLERFSNQLTRVEVHLSDENGGKGGDADKRCVMEARLDGMPPIAVTHDAATIEVAIDGAVGRLERAIGSALGRLRSA